MGTLWIVEFEFRLNETRGEPQPAENARLDWTDLAPLSLQSAIIVPYGEDLFVAFRHLPVIQRYDAQRRLVFQSEVAAAPVLRIIDQLLDNGGSCDGAKRVWIAPPGVTLLDLIPVSDGLVVSTPSGLFLIENAGREAEPAYWDAADGNAQSE